MNAERRRTTWYAALAALLILQSAACHRENTYEGQPLAHWYAALADTNTLVRSQAARIVSQAAPEHPETVRRLLDALTAESDSTVHAALAEALGEVVGKNPNSPEIMQSIVALTRDQHESVRIAAIAAVGHALTTSPPGTALNPAGEEVLRSSLRDLNHHIRIASAEAIRGMTRTRSAEMTSLAPDVAERVLSDRVLYVRLVSLEAFTHLESTDSLAVLVYGAALRDDWTDMSRFALRGMMHRPTVIAGFAESIAAKLRDEDQEIRTLSANALGDAGPRAARPFVIEGLKRASTDRDSTVRSAASAALLRLRGTVR